MNLPDEQQKMRERNSSPTTVSRAKAELDALFDDKIPATPAERYVKSVQDVWAKGFIDDKEAAKIYKNKQKERKKKKPLTNVNSILVDFWSSAKIGSFNGHDTKTTRLELLRQMAAVCVKPVGWVALKKKRRSFDGVKNSKFPILNNLCWCCEHRPASIRHHLIQLQNGGPVTTANNILYLCEHCHAEVHPWLGAPKSVLPPDFHLAKSKADAGDLLEKAAKGRVTREVAEKMLLGYLHSVFNTLEKDG
jgi:hypothetical protein